MSLCGSHAGGPRFGAIAHSLSAADHALIVGLVNVSNHVDLTVTQLADVAAAASGAVTGVIIGIIFGILGLCGSCCGAYYFFVMLPQMARNAALIRNEASVVNVELGKNGGSGEAQSI